MSNELARAIFHKVCKHSNEYKLSRPIVCITEKEPFVETVMFPELFENWKHCKSCILRKVPWKAPHSMGKIKRDVCFAIWHNGILETKGG